MNEREQDEKLVTILDELMNVVVAAEEFAIVQPSWQAKQEAVEVIVEALCEHIGNFAGRYRVQDGMMIMASICKSAGWSLDEGQTREKPVRFTGLARLKTEEELQASKPSYSMAHDPVPPEAA